MNRLSEEKICPNCQSRNLSNAKYCMKCGHELPFVEIQPELVAEKTKKPANSGKKRIITAIFTVLSFFAAYFLVQKLFFAPPGFDKILMDAASELNKTCPVMVDAETRFDNAVTLPHNIFQYNYTLVNIEKSAVDTIEFKRLMEPGLINQVKTTPQMEVFRKNKVTMNYNYRDKNGAYITLISITKDEYN